MKRKKTDTVVIKDELHSLRKIEAEMAKLERQRKRYEARLVKDASGAPHLLKTRHARRSLGSYALVRFRRRQLSYFIVTTMGVLMVWVGAWQLIEQYITNPWFSIVGGLAIVWATRHYH